MPSQSGLLALNILDDCDTGSSKAIIDLPAGLAGQPSDLFDKLIAFTFDVLGRQAVEQREYEAGVSLRLNRAARMYRERRD
ncbi:MAG: hypothetical protein ABIV47_14705 [Roseiflexaceae bacterium]